MRMDRTGLDGRSRGDLDAEVSLGCDLRKFLPLDGGSFKMSVGTFRRWLKYWLGNQYSEPLTPLQWFYEGHKAGCHL